MTVNDIMFEHLDNVKRVISHLPVVFDSHQFIEKISKEIETEYIDLLNGAGDENQFRTVNMQIGRFLSTNKEELGIVSMGKTKSKNVFGNFSECEKWGKPPFTFNDLLTNFEEFEGYKFKLEPTSLIQPNILGEIILSGYNKSNNTLVFKNKDAEQIPIVSSIGVVFELVL